LPLTAVTSRPLWPPRGPRFSYWPDTGAGAPERKPRVLGRFAICFTFLEIVSNPLASLLIEAAPGGFGIGHVDHQQLVVAVDMRPQAVAKFGRALLGS
jgi:hypothetical protein